eukprot:scaffold29795_cov46-Phaeocystis_antarctica.AAC.3
MHTCPRRSTHLPPRASSARARATCSSRSRIHLRRRTYPGRPPHIEQLARCRWAARPSELLRVLHPQSVTSSWQPIRKVLPPTAASDLVLIAPHFIPLQKRNPL